MSTALNAAALVGLTVAGYLIGAALLAAWDRWQSDRKGTTR